MAALLLEIKEQGLHSLQGKLSCLRVLLLLAMATWGCGAGTIPSPEKQREGRYSGIGPPPPPPSHPHTWTPRLPLCLQQQRWKRSHRITEVGKDPSGHHTQPQPITPCPLSMSLSRTTESLGLEKTSKTTQCNPTHPTAQSQHHWGWERSFRSQLITPAPLTTSPTATSLPFCIGDPTTSPFQCTTALLEQKYLLIPNLETKPQRGEPPS